MIFSKNELRQNLWGCFEILLFMKQGIDCFPVTRGAAVKSFLVPLVLMPLTLLVFVLKSTGYPAVLLLSVHGVRMLFAFSLFLGVMYIFCRQYDRMEQFYRFVTAHNWLNVPMTLLMLPLIAVLFVGQISDGDLFYMENFYSYAVFITVASYIYIAFIATVALRIPWEMGGFLAIVCLFINETGLDLAVLVRDTLA